MKDIARADIKPAFAVRNVPVALATDENGRGQARRQAEENRDAILKNYVKLARFIHDGERVLDFAPIDTSSAAALSENSLAADVVTVAEFSKGALDGFPDFHFDAIVVSALADGSVRLNELVKILPALRRVLMPAGRLLVIVPDPLAQLCAGRVGAYLIPEPPIKGVGNPGVTLAVFMRNPLVGRGVPYRETSWVVPEAPEYNMLAFARDYLNPWLIRGIVSGCGCARLSNPEAMAIVNRVLNGFSFKKASAVEQLKKSKTPTLFIHSEEDYRCPLAEGMQMMQALAERGVDTRLVLFHGENHELSRSGKPSHRIRRLSEITGWFRKYTNVL